MDEISNYSFQVHKIWGKKKKKKHFASHMVDFPIIFTFVHSCHIDSLSFRQEQGDIVLSLQSESMQALNLSKPCWAVLSSELENAGCLPAVLDCLKRWFSNIFMSQNPG